MEEKKEEVVRKFNNWNILKIDLHLNDNKKFPKEKQIWWASLGQNIGVEINGKNKKFERPVLVVKKYNKNSFLVLPISSKEKNNCYRFNFTDSRDRKNSVNFSQIRIISNRRFIRKMGNTDIIIFKIIKERLKKSI